jgi:c-di-GMP-binding flagellar brake protein YcgR
LIELRRYQRAPLDVSVEFSLRTGPDADQRHPGRSRDISLGGMFVITEQPLSFGSELLIYVALPSQKALFALPGVVRWSRVGEGMGVQFGLMGARETHAITELTRAPVP